MLNDKEKMSAFMDGELRGEDASVFMERLLGDAELKKNWSRLHAVSYLLKYAEKPASLGSDAFASKIYNLVQEEPTVLAPKALDGRHAPLPLWGKFGAVAIAASVGFVSFVMLQPRDPSVSAFDKTLTTPMVNSSQIQGNISSTGITPASDTIRQWAPVDLAPESSLELYLARQRAQDQRFEFQTDAGKPGVVQKVGQAVAH